MSVYDVQMTYLHMLELNEPAIKKQLPYLVIQHIMRVYCILLYSMTVYCSVVDPDDFCPIPEIDF
jgi:hypothetical protein